jgi:superfamily II DNA or RNA helicase
MRLRPYQEKFFAAVRGRREEGVNRQLGVLATGLGKACLYSALRDQMGFEKKILVLVHREELANQGADKLQRWNPGLMIGVEKAERSSSPMDTLIVASVPTIGRRGSSRILKFNPEDFDAVVSDEAHHLKPGSQWANVLEYFGLLRPSESPILSLGLTATPNRSDGVGLRVFFDCITFDMGIREGIDSGYLVDLKGLRVAGRANLDHVHSRAGDFAEEELSKEVNTPQRNAIIVKEWMKHAYGKKTIVFTVDVQHALDLAAAFKAHVVEADAVWGDDPDRARKLADHRDGRITVLCNCAILTEGYDDPGVEVIIDAAPTKSALRYTQKIGRGTRIPADIDNLHEARAAGLAISKDSCLIIDVVDNCSKHSLMTMPSLLGLPKDLDLKGKSITKAQEQIERIAREFPTANIQDIKSLDQLKSIAENISLFHVAYPPEISTLSELAWRKADNGYCLAVNREMVTISQDLRQEWWVRGSLNGKRIEQSSQNLPGAFNQADRMILDNGGCLPILRRTALWRDSKPSEKQVDLCRKLGIAIPRDATKGQVSAALTLKLRSRELQYQREPEYQGEF